MLGFLSTVRTRPAVRTARRTQLGVTWLETRDTPSTLTPAPAAAPVLSPLSAVAQPDGTVLVSGHVTDANPATATVTVGGAASAQFHPNAQGDFGVVVHLSGNGTVITVQALDDQNLPSNAVTYDTALAPPSSEGQADRPGSLGAAGIPSGPTAATTTVTAPDPVPMTATPAGGQLAAQIQVTVLTWETRDGYVIAGDVTGDFPVGSHVEIVSSDDRVDGLTGDLNGDGSYEIDVALPTGSVVNIEVQVVDPNGNVIGSGTGQIGGL